MAGKMRSVEDAEKMIAMAKLDQNDLQPEMQSLVFTDRLTPDDFCLMELNQDLLKTLLEGHSLVIRGDKDEPAVLCTANNTYEMKDAETSNSLLLLPELSMPNTITSSRSEKSLETRFVNGVFHSYAEFRPCKPKVKKLRDVLAQNLYQGPEYDVENVGAMYTSEDLLDIIQASEAELYTALKQIPAFCINGEWRMLDFDYLFRIFSFILNLIDSNSLPIDEIPKTVVLDTLEELAPRDILEQCFDLYAEQASQGGQNGDTYKLKETAVCQFYAEVLLKPSGKFNLQEFQETWQKSVPEGMTTDLSQLEGLALVDHNSKPEVIFSFPVSDLPEDINERFNTLFKTREKWTFNDIRPYIQDLATDNLNVNALLTKYARTSTLNGTKFYNSKHTVA